MPTDKDYTGPSAPFTWNGAEDQALYDNRQEIHDRMQAYTTREGDTVRSTGVPRELMEQHRRLMLMSVNGGGDALSRGYNATSGLMG